LTSTLGGSERLISFILASTIALGRVGVAVTGTHWWTMPSNWGRIVERSLAPLGQFNRYLSENAPSEFARRLGAPVLQASHCGKFRTGFLLAPGLSLAPPYDNDDSPQRFRSCGDRPPVLHRREEFLR
jgi:hypothetical protein